MNEDNTFHRSDVQIDNQGCCIIPEGVRSIGRGAFECNSSLRAVQLPHSLEQIEARAFRKCSSLSAVRIPSGLKKLGANAFEHCTSLQRIDLPEGLEEIGAGAFSHCSALVAFKVPESVRRLGKHVLFLCSEQIAVTLPQHLQQAGLAPAQQLGVPDGNGQVIEGDVLLHASGDIISVPAGVRCIAADALPGTRWMMPSVRILPLPPSVEIIRRNALFRNGAKAEVLPPDYFTHSTVLCTDPNAALLKKRLAMPGAHLREAAAVFLIQNEEFLPAALSVLEQASPAAAADTLLRCLQDPRFRRAKCSLARAAVFWFAHQTELPADFGSQLRELYTAGASPAEAWQETLRNAVLSLAAVDPELPAFRRVERADGMGPADPALVKGAVVPYLAQAFLLHHAEQWCAPKSMPVADADAAQLNRASLQAVLPVLLPCAGRTAPLQLPAYLRFASEAQVERMADQRDWCPWMRGARRTNCSHKARCQALKNGILLSDTDRATEYAATHVCGCDNVYLKNNNNMLTPFLHRQLHDGTKTRLLYPAHLKMQENGRRLFQTADGAVRLLLEQTQDKFCYRNLQTNRIVTGIPKAMDSMRAEIREERRRIERHYQGVCGWLDRELYQLFCTGQGMPPGLWFRLVKERLLQEKLGGIVWQQDETFFTSLYGQAVDLGQKPVTLDPGKTVVPATPSDIPEPLLEAWRGIPGLPTDSMICQLSGPHYDPAALEPDRFLGCHVLEDDLFRNGCQLVQTWDKDVYPLGAAGHLELTRDHSSFLGPTQYIIGRFVPADTPRIDHTAHHLLYRLDEATFSERLKRDDPTLISFLAGISPSRFAVYLEKVMKEEAPRTRAAALEISSKRSRPKTADIFLE